MATIEGWRRARLADAPSGLPCDNCSEIHESQSAEDACILEAELEDWVGPAGTNSDILSLVQPTKLQRLVEGFYDGKVDAAEVRAAIREGR